MIPGEQQKTMGTWPVFLTAVSTILGAILFLRFGYSIAHVGLIQTLLIILVGHMVTIPAALAVAEIATNQKVEGGGAYFMISRSFGLNIGGSIGITLFLSQAISVAFYIIAFTVSIRGLLAWIELQYGVALDPLWVNLGMMGLLTLLMLTKGANVGVKALYVVVAALVVALISFFIGSGPGNPNLDPTATIPEILHTPTGTINRYGFFEVFTFIFPAFTGIAAGLGLSGDLKDPRISIPKGTIYATIVGIVVYVAVSFKLWWSAPLEHLAMDELYMEKISVWPPMIAIGLAAAAISSALGSVMIAPRTLQALAVDGVFPDNMSEWLSKGKGVTNEPVRASFITCLIGFAFVSIGDINAVAEIISMFFMVTYGAICLVSFLEYMAADPSYRPTFKSHWSISLEGAVLCIALMFGMNTPYAIASIVIMILIHAWVARKGNQSGMVRLFKGIIFQITRSLQLALQMNDDDHFEDEAGWRPFVLAISPDSFKRREGYDMVRWIAHRHGFGTYMHFIKGFLNSDTKKEAKQSQKELVDWARGSHSRVHLDTIISPSFTSAIAQCVQLPGLSGKGNNLFLMEYDPKNIENRDQLLDNLAILEAADLDHVLLRSSGRAYGNKHDIHLWITPDDGDNASLMILLAYIIQSHPEWGEASISVFFIHQGSDDEHATKIRDQILEGRIPIAEQNIEFIQTNSEEEVTQKIVNKSGGADLVILGFLDGELAADHGALFERYHGLGETMFVHSNNAKIIK
ncbi:MAG: amino acid permease [Euryarchaeota archaeon]|nr:amino acid permease [Euryarchaeota archaeon]